MSLKDIWGILFFLSGGPPVCGEGPELNFCPSFEGKTTLVRQTAHRTPGSFGLARCFKVLASLWQQEAARRTGVGPGSTASSRGAAWHRVFSHSPLTLIDCLKGNVYTSWSGGEGRVTNGRTRKCEAFLFLWIASGLYRRLCDLCSGNS